jgi:hypothetical protein
MFAFSAVSVGKLKEMQNGGKRARRGIDQWDQVRPETLSLKALLTARSKVRPSMMTACRTHHDTVMERDRRLTGFARGQTDKPIAPAGFELNNPWRVRTVTGHAWAVLTAYSASSASSKGTAWNDRTWSISNTSYVCIGTSLDLRRQPSDAIPLHLPELDTKILFQSIQPVVFRLQLNFLLLDPMYPPLNGVAEQD